MNTQPNHKCLQSGCTNRVPASSETGFCELHEYIAAQFTHDLSEDVPTDSYKTPIPICTDCGTPLNDGGRCPTCDDLDLDDPDAPELDDEEQGRIEEYLRHEGLSIDTPITLSAISLAQQETPPEPVLVPCPWCIPGTMHYKYQLDLCPNNPYKQR